MTDTERLLQAAEKAFATMSPAAAARSERLFLAAHALGGLLAWNPSGDKCLPDGERAREYADFATGYADAVLARLDATATPATTPERTDCGATPPPESDRLRGYRCTLGPAHGGDHVSRNTVGYEYARWPLSPSPSLAALQQEIDALRAKVASTDAEIKAAVEAERDRVAALSDRWISQLRAVLHMAVEDVPGSDWIDKARLVRHGPMTDAALESA